MKSLICTAFALLVMFAAQSIGAAEADLAERIAGCARERDDARRLACFDRESAQLPAAGEAAAAPAPVATQKVQVPEDFGLAGSEAARKRDAQKPQEEPVPQKMTGTVTAISRRPRGELVLTLDNGQIWAEKKAGTYFPVKVGDSVTIIAGALGSFHLVAANRTTQVTRVE